VNPQGQQPGGFGQPGAPGGYPGPQPPAFGGQGRGGQQSTPSFGNGYQGAFPPPAPETAPLPQQGQYPAQPPGGYAPQQPAFPGAAPGGFPQGAPGGYPGQQPGGFAGAGQQQGGFTAQPPASGGFAGQQPGAFAGQQAGGYTGAGQQPGGFAGQPGGFAGAGQQPGGFAGQPGGFAGQPGGFAGQPGGFAGQPGGFPGQQGGFAAQPPGPGGFPGQQGGFAAQPPGPGGFPGQQGGFAGYPQEGFSRFQQEGFGGGMPGQLAPAAVTSLDVGKQGATSRGKKRGKTGLLIGTAIVVAAVAAGAVIEVPKYLGPSDPGCKAYTGTALSAYNQAIGDLNAQASQTKMTSDMGIAIPRLSAAAGQAKSASVKAALGKLLAELNTVRVDVQNGSVPAQTVTALNSAATSADKAC
jgi:hypothetical protein